MIAPEELYAFMPFAMYLTKNEPDAKDLLHDAYIRLHTCEYEDRGRAAGMIRMVIVNRFIDLYRKKRKFGTFVSPDFVSDTCRQTDFESEDLSHRQRAIIARYLFNLNPRDKKIWDLHIDGFSQKQIVELMGMNLNAMSAVLFRIKQKLIKTIQG